MTYPTTSGNQDVLCIELNYLPLWLAKININIIQDENIRNKLIEYQLKVKDVLSEAFIENKIFNIPRSYSEALMLASSLAEEAEQFRVFMKSDKGIDMDEVANILKIPNLGRNNLYKWLKEHKILQSGIRNNIPYSIFSHHFDVIEVINNGKPYPKVLVKPSGIDFILKRIKKEKRLLETVN